MWYNANMSEVSKEANKHGLPVIFKPILWSYCFEEVNPETSKKAIILNALNYGTLAHWRWIAQKYGEDEIKRVLSSVPETALRSGSKKLAVIFFSITNFNHAPRGAH